MGATSAAQSTCGRASGAASRTLLKLKFGLSVCPVGVSVHCGSLGAKALVLFRALGTCLSKFDKNGQETHQRKARKRLTTHNTYHPWRFSSPDPSWAKLRLYYPLAKSDNKPPAVYPHAQPTRSPFTRPPGPAAAPRPGSDPPAHPSSQRCVAHTRPSPLALPPPLFI